MTHPNYDDHALLRRLVGEASSEEDSARLDARLDADRALRRRLDAFERVWRDLEGPPELELPEDFAARLQLRARDEATSWRWSVAPAWARAGMAAALAIGLALGAGVARFEAPSPTPAVSAPGPVVEVDDLDGWQRLGGGSLAEEFWQALDGLDEAGPAAAPTPEDAT